MTECRSQKARDKLSEPSDWVRSQRFSYRTHVHVSDGIIHWMECVSNWNETHLKNKLRIIIANKPKTPSHNKLTEHARHRAHIECHC